MFNLLTQLLNAFTAKSAKNETFEQQLTRIQISEERRNALQDQLDKYLIPREEIPNHYLDPITNSIMQRPVELINAPSDQIVDESTVREWNAEAERDGSEKFEYKQFEELEKEINAWVEGKIGLKAKIEEEIEAIRVEFSKLPTKTVTEYLDEINTRLDQFKLPHAKIDKEFFDDHFSHEIMTFPVILTSTSSNPIRVDFAELLRYWYDPEKTQNRYFHPLMRDMVTSVKVDKELKKRIDTFIHEQAAYITKEEAAYKIPTASSVSAIHTLFGGHKTGLQHLVGKGVDERKNGMGLG